MRRRILIALALIVAVLGTWLSMTDHPGIWPVRNTVQYHVLHRWEALVGRSPRQSVTVQGMVQTPQGRPIPHARVVVADRAGTPYSAESDGDGQFTIRNVPAGKYVPVGGAEGYADHALRRLGLFRVGLDGTIRLNLTLTPRPFPAAPIVPAGNFRLDAPAIFEVDVPRPATAIRQVVHFEVARRPNQLTLYYTPDDSRDTPVPTLLIVYPGPADAWESVSLPLAQAGYAVLAVGPAYTLDLEPDVDDLERLLDAVKAGQFPRADPARIGVLAGSYSSLHVFRLLQRSHVPIQAALFLGPATDLFELRRQFSVGEIMPPFGLDRALIALGFPDRNPEPYWRYSARYHARALHAPMMLVHSRSDEVVPFQQSQLLSDELTRIGRPHELHILEGMGHYLRATERTPALDALFSLTLDYFQEHLQRAAE